MNLAQLEIGPNRRALKIKPTFQGELGNPEIALGALNVPFKLSQRAGRAGIASVLIVLGSLEFAHGIEPTKLLQARVAGLKLKDTWCFHSTAHRRVKAAIEEVRHARTNNRQVASWTTPGAPHTSERFPRTPVSVILNGNAFGGLPMAALSVDCTANNRDSTIREVCAQPDLLSGPSTSLPSISFKDQPGLGGLRTPGALKEERDAHFSYSCSVGFMGNNHASSGSV